MLVNVISMRDPVIFDVLTNQGHVFRYNLSEEDALDKISLLCAAIGLDTLESTEQLLGKQFLPHEGYLQ